MGNSFLNGRVLIVSGSDSSGGAGLQADLKTVTAFGGYAATAVTAVTEQNTFGVSSVHSIPPSFVASQIKAVLTDIGADVIKIGMLGSVGIVKSVSDSCGRFAPGIPCVVDPVMVAKGGHRLISDDAIDALKNYVVKGATLVTPNLPEAEVLTGRCIKTLRDMEAAVEALRSLGAKATLLKGGHVQGDDIMDLLITNERVESFVGHRLDSSSTHGTGCTLASAIAAGLAQKLHLSDAVRQARDYVRDAILTAPNFGGGQGPLNHVHSITRSSI